MNTALASNDPEQKSWQKLETLSMNIEQSYQQLHDSVKHYDYKKIDEISPKFTKDVMAYLNELRHLKEKLNGSISAQDVKRAFKDKILYLNQIASQLDVLKTLSKSYKKNDVFLRTPELRQIMDTEDVRIMELEQALNAVINLVSV